MNILKTFHRNSNIFYFIQLFWKRVKHCSQYIRVRYELVLCSWYIVSCVKMLQKQSWLFLTDNTNVCWVKIFQLYKGSFRNFSHEGLFVKGSARVVEPPRLEYKGFKYRYKVKGDICRIWIVRTKRLRLSLDYKGIKFNDNSGININKKVNIMSKYINGPVSRALFRKKLITLFKKVI